MPTRAQNYLTDIQPTYVWEKAFTGTQHAFTYKTDCNECRTNIGQNMKI